MKRDKSSSTGERNKEIRLSAVIITKNEEDNIIEAIKSVQWADEVVIVDSGSDDNTVNLAKEVGARIYIHTWEGYVAQKNWANDKARGEWILSLDADERVTRELKQEIQNVLSDEKEYEFSGYYIPRRSNFLGRWIQHCHWYPDYQLRLFLKKKSRWAGGLVHERVEVEGRVGRLKNDLHHYTYGSIEDQIERLNRYSTLWAQQAADKGKKTNIFSIILSPLLTFVNVYIFRLGILDGFPGLVISRGLAYYSFQKKAKLRELNRKELKDGS